MKTRFLVSALFLSLIITGSYSQEIPSVYTYKFGSMEISLLQERSKNDKPEILIGITPEIIEECASEGTFPGAINAFVVRANGKNILIDSGFGTKLFDNLQSLGIAAEDIDVVLLTHLHGDHISGMVKDGKISFPDAQVYLSQREYDYWMNETEDERSHAMLTAYKDQLHLFQPGIFTEEVTEIVPGIQALAAYGHTPGHTAYLLTSEDERFLVIGDVINVAAVQFPYPQIPAIYDKNSGEAHETRIRVLDYASKNNIPIAGMHIPYSGMGYVSANQKEGFEFKAME